MNDTTAYDSAYARALNYNNAIPATNTPAGNFKFIQGIYLAGIARGNSYWPDSPTLQQIYDIANQCPYAAGDAVYYARSLYAQYTDAIDFDDITLCTVNEGEDRMMRVNTQQDTSQADKEFVKVYPNPAKNLINLVYYASTTGIVNFELLDELGQKVLMQPVGGASAQYTTNNLNSGLYYWRLVDADRTIRTGKIVIIK